jgi:hypothetical protein
MATATQCRSLESVRAEHHAVSEEIRALTIRRAMREVDRPELYRYYDDEHRELTNKIERLYGRMGDLARELASASGNLLSFACAESLIKEHKYCNGRFKTKGGNWLRCGCECHQSKKGS